MGPDRTSLRFIVGTTLLAATTAATASNCAKPNINTTAPIDGPNVDPLESPQGGSTGGPEVNPGQGPIVNTAAPPTDPAKSPDPEAPDPGPVQPVLNAPPELEAPTINVVTAPPKPGARPKKKGVKGPPG